MHIVVGLGNPGAEYELSRHNAGRFVADLIAASKPRSIKVLTPDTFMNDSGRFVKKFVTSASAAARLIVIHDDLDLPLGAMRIVFDRSSGGHRGVESIMKTLRTQKFIRIRIGLSPTTAKGKLKKPRADKVIDFVLKPFTPKELAVLKKVSKRALAAVEMIADRGLAAAQTEFNSN